MTLSQAIRHSGMPSRMATLSLTLISSSSFVAAGETNPQQNAVKTVNISCGDFRGGFGDIASNIIMYRELKRAYPDIQFRMVFDSSKPNVEKKLRVLLPGFDPRKQVQQVGDVTVLTFDPKATLPPESDIFLEFSSKGPSGAIPKSTVLSLYFEEYTDLYPNFREYTRGVYYGGTTGPKSGFYVSPKRPDPPMSRQAVFDRLREAGVISEAEARNFSKSKLGFAYTADSKYVLPYIEFLARRAHSDPAGSYIAIVSGTAGVDLEVPKNLKVVRHSGLPLDVSEALVAHSNVPILVTGDGSLTFALQYEKPFAYDLNSWKFGNVFTLHKALAREEPQIVGALGDLLGLNDLPHYLPGSDLPHYNSRYDQLTSALRHFDSPETEVAFTRAIQRLREKISLPAQFQSLWRQLESMPDWRAKPLPADFVRTLDSVFTRPQPVDPEATALKVLGREPAEVGKRARRSLLKKILDAVCLRRKGA